MTKEASSDDDPGMLDRLDAGEPARSPEETAARAPYEHLIGRIQDLSDIDPPVGWEDRAMARWTATRRKRRRGMVIGAGVGSLALAVMIFLLHPCAAPNVTGLELAVVTGSGAARRGEAAVGDVLHVRARAEELHVELRIYLGATRIARCPGSPECRGDAPALQIDWKLADAGLYEIVVLSSPAAIPPGDGTRDRDLLDAQTASVRIDTGTVKVSL